MGNRIFVGNLPYSLSEQDLRDAFASCGTVIDAKVVTDRETGQSRGFAFVGFENEAQAKVAIDTWNGENLGGRNIIVNEAHDKNAGGQRPAGGPQQYRSGPPNGGGRGRDGGGRGRRNRGDDSDFGG